MLSDLESGAVRAFRTDVRLLHRVSVSSVTLAAMVFFVAAGQDIAASPLETAADNPNQETLATGIVTICPVLAGMGGSSLTGDVGDLFDRCNGAIVEATSGSSATAADILGQIASEEITAQQSVVDGTVAPQTRAIAGRLSALGGHSRVGFAQAGWENVSFAPQFASASPGQVAAGDDGASGSGLSGLGVFLNGSYNFGDKDATSLEAGYDFDDYSITGGVDYFFADNFVAGVAAGYGLTEIDFDAGAGDIEGHGVTGAIYAFYNPLDQLGVTGLMSFTQLDYDSTRILSYTDPNGVVNRRAEGDTQADQIELSGTVYYDFTTDAFTYGPTGRVGYSALSIDGFTETGAQGLNITYPDQDNESLVTALGAAGSYAISTGFGVAVLQARGEWVHEYLDDARTVTLQYAADPTSTGFNLTTDSPDRDRFLVGGGASVLFAGGISAFADFETVLGHEDVMSYTVTGGIRLELN